MSFKEYKFLIHTMKRKKFNPFGTDGYSSSHPCFYSAFNRVAHFLYVSLSASLGHHSVASSCEKMAPFSVLTATPVAALLFN